MIFNFDTEGASIYDPGLLSFGLSEEFGAYIIINFHNLAGQLILSRPVPASVYAPTANVVIQNAILAGQVAAKNLAFRGAAPLFYESSSVRPQ